MSLIQLDPTMQDVVVSTRVRLARNFSELPFPPKQNDVIAAEVVRRTAAAMAGAKDARRYELHRLVDVLPVRRAQWMERHLISPLLLDRMETAAVLMRDDAHVSIMINEEDHLRIQAMLPGFQMEEASRLSGVVDDVIESSVDYAFEERWGYLTACPSNAGTGMRASAMMHLPALAVSGQMNALINSLGKIGLTVRGMYGEGSEAQANLYQISNQVTLGCSEEDIVTALSSAVSQVVDRERLARETIFSKRAIEMEDHVWRSLGILKSARRMDIKEFMQLISTLRLGHGLGMVGGISLDEIDRLLIDVQPAGLMSNSGGATSEDREILRARFVRDRLASARAVEPGEETAESGEEPQQPEQA